ncbi:MULTISPECIES: hypothetical protein [Streptomyces]|uniref:Uncharacterized protein n=2 Tax=Streptomyces TaxID=1883 RepID=A0ABV9J5N6_9ACTN
MDLSTPVTPPPLPAADPDDFPAYMRGQVRDCTQREEHPGHGITLRIWSEGDRDVRWDLYQYGPRVGTYRTAGGARRRIARLIAAA